MVLQADQISYIKLSNAILISKEEYDELVNYKFDSIGKIEDLAWFKEQIHMTSSNKVKLEILYPNQEEMESFVRFPKRKGEHWKFLKRATQKWIEENPEKVFV